LSNEHPTVFQAFYDWLYSGQVRESKHYDEAVPSETYWPRVYAMAARMKIEVLQGIAFASIRALLGEEKSRVPSPGFIAALFSDQASNKLLERYIISRCAFYLRAGELAD
jgi:hypothetical protein